MAEFWSFYGQLMKNEVISTLSDCTRFTCTPTWIKCILQGLNVSGYPRYPVDSDFFHAASLNFLHALSHYIWHFWTLPPVRKQKFMQIWCLDKYFSLKGRRWQCSQLTYLVTTPIFTPNTPVCFREGRRFRLNSRLVNFSDNLTSIYRKNGQLSGDSEKFQLSGLRVRCNWENKATQRNRKILEGGMWGKMYSMKIWPIYMLSNTACGGHMYPHICINICYLLHS